MGCKYFVALNDDNYKETVLDVLGIELKNFKTFLQYEFDNDISKENFEKMLGKSEIPKLEEKDTLIIEPLNSQFCMRNTSLEEILKMNGIKVQGKVSTVYTFETLSKEDIETLENYSYNPVEKKVKKIDEPSIFKQSPSLKSTSIEGFNDLDSNELKEYYTKEGLSMTFDDIQYVQKYFLEEGRNPTETELKVIDTYWSDHCRHTTFNTTLSKIVIDNFKYSKLIEDSLKLYLNDKKELNRDAKPLTLMDIATQAARYHKNIDGEKLVEVSDEVNAASIVVNIEVDGIEEPWLLMFKNETHNHPTEIEPFGGAATCVGGAIRDPLSGRAYVYQAMRIGGTGDILTPYKDTLDHKLPQRTIATVASLGNASYGNQIGLTNTYSRDVYHDSYLAKHMELGAVVGAVRQKDVLRGTPKLDDVIVMLGGRTGRDGVGGATGSSVMHDKESIKESASEVQKGNPHIERKIIKLFKNPEVSKLIVSSNDFGAGGVSVAIGELADSIHINLDKVNLKYEGLNACEIAISESQERMAVVLDPKDLEFFLEACEKESIEASVVAKVTDTQRLVMEYKNEIIFDISREFIDSSGVVQNTEVHVTDNNKVSPFVKVHDNSKEDLVRILSTLEFTSQKPMIQSFDFSIGQSTVFSPLAGKNQLTENIASIQTFPIKDTNTVSVLTQGFIPKLSEYNPYLGAYMSVYESVLKTIAVGGLKDKMALSFQEYFNRLTSYEKWGNVLQTMLGSYQAQKDLKLSAIGGKDSMSGSFEDLDVLDTFVSFACSKQESDKLVTADIKNTDSYLYKIESPLVDGAYKLDFEALDAYQELIKDKKVLSAMSTEHRTELLTLIQMALGNDIGFEVYEDLNIFNPGVLVFESKDELDSKHFKLIGKTHSEDTVRTLSSSINLEDLKSAYTKTLKEIYPCDEAVLEASPYSPKSYKVNGLKAYIPLFTGTVNEIDLKNKLEENGYTVLMSRIDTEDLKQSISTFKAHLEETDLLILTGDYVPNDELIGKQSIIANFLNLPEIKESIETHIEKGHKILGLDGGYNGLIQVGLLPYGKYVETDNSLNTSLRAKNLLVDLKCINNKSSWLGDINVDESVRLPLSTYFNSITLDEKTKEYIEENKNTKFIYKDLPEMMVSNDDNVCGSITHDARINTNTFKNQNVLGKGLFMNIGTTIERGNK